MISNFSLPFPTPVIQTPIINGTGIPHTSLSGLPSVNPRNISELTDITDILTRLDRYDAQSTPTSEGKSIVSRSIQWLRSKVPSFSYSSVSEPEHHRQPGRADIKASESSQAEALLSGLNNTHTDNHGRRSKRDISDNAQPGLDSATTEENTTGYDQICRKGVGNRPKIFADYHVNPGPRSSVIKNKCLARPSLPGIIVNGYQLLDANGQDPRSVSQGVLGSGSLDRPLVGSVVSDHYFEWQLMVARAAGLDGFVVEWGYPNPNSSQDKAMKAMKAILAKKERGDNFSIVPLWLPTWTALSSKYQGMSNAESFFYQKLKENIEQYYQDKHCVHYLSHPLVFVLNFRGTNRSDIVLNRERLAGLFRDHPSLNVTRMAYRLGNDRRDWQASSVDQVVSDLPWLVPRNRLAEQSGSALVREHFHKYANHDDIARYVESIDQKNKDFKAHLPVKILSVAPGIDTRGSWAGCASYLPRAEGGQNTLEFNWDQVLSKKPDVVIIETFNDYSEDTQIEPSVNNGDENVVSNAEKGCLLREKSATHCSKVASKAKKLVDHATQVYQARTLMDKLKHIFSDDAALEKPQGLLDRWANSVFNKHIRSLDGLSSKFHRAVSRLPFSETPFTFTGPNLPELKNTDAYSYFNLTATLPEAIFSDSRWVEGDIKLSFHKTEGAKQKQLITLSTPDKGKNENIAEFYTSSDKDDFTFRVPLNNRQCDNYETFPRSYQIFHPGYKVDIDEIRVVEHAKGR